MWVQVDSTGKVQCVNYMSEQPDSSFIQVSGTIPDPIPGANQQAVLYYTNNAFSYQYVTVAPNLESRIAAAEAAINSLLGI